MKLIDAIRNVKRPEGGYPSAYSAPIEECCEALGIQTLWNYDSALDERFKRYPIATWNCTDTHVGLYALYLDGAPVGITFQIARKSATDVKWLSEEIAKHVRDVLLSYGDIPTYDIINPDEFIDKNFAVAYVDQVTTDDGFYEDRPVKILIRYEGLGGFTTPVQHRREGRSYTESVPYEDPKSNCVLVQDGDEQRVIPIDEFRMAINVTEEEIVADLDVVEACQMMAGIRPNRMRDDDDFLAAGTGPLWEVRVQCDLGDSNYTDFEVRAETAEEAAVKAETVARRHADIYFDTSQSPEYHALRHDIHQMEEDPA